MDEGLKHNWHAVEGLLSDWSQQACFNSLHSRKKAKHAKWLHRGLGILIIIFSSIVGSAAFSQIHAQTGNNRVRLLAGVLSIVAAILAGLQTFFHFGETAEKYRAVGIGYEKVEKEIEEILALPESLRGKLPEQLDSIRDQMNTLADGSPEIPSHRHPDKTPLKVI